ncbi:accessory Sec system protein Asp2 [Lactococcus sp. S64]|uniref:accessory Sec system protein Asp2 n=1 Tax=Lactococcus sp. S64 TaxID=2767459 RepID=UPI00351B5CE1
MSEPSKKLFQIGGARLPKLSELVEAYDYHPLDISEGLKGELLQLQALEKDEINNSTDLFLLRKEAMFQLECIDLIRLPSHQIFYETLEGASEAEVRILKLKGAQLVNLIDQGEGFSQFINQNYVKPWGTSLDPRRVEIHPDFEGLVTKKGSGKVILEGAFGLDDYQQVLVWKNNWGGSGRVKFYPEISASGSVSYFFRAYFKNKKKDSHSEMTIIDISSEQIKRGQVSLELDSSEFPVNFALFAKGQGKVQVGDLHLRYGLSGDHFLAMGGKRLVQKGHMGEELGVYFNAGDLKPPLNVYFSGFRPSEGYEGRWMMGSLGSPFLLVHDPRLVGGAFYRGPELEEALVKEIQEKLDLLGFTNKELVLSGLSMGTYASFYYGAQLEPHAIVVGKPLANIGGLAVHSRIFSPYDWDLAMDTLIHLTGALTKESASALDEAFWEKFEGTNFSETTFIIAHMLQDTDRPFKRIFDHLKQNYPSAKVLHKGLEGRHNDDTPGVTSWFYKQYQQLLISDFDRSLIIDEEASPINLEGENDE